MKLERVHDHRLSERELLSRWGPLGLGLLIAIVFGYWIGAGQQPLLILSGAVCVAAFVMIAMQKRAWVLIMFGWLFTGNLLVLRLPFAVRDLMVMLALGAYIGYRVISQRTVRAGGNLIDMLLAVHLVYLVFGWALHPVGFRVMGAETIGARAYVNIALAVMGYWVLVHLPDSVRAVSRIPYYWFAAAAVLGIMALLARVFPSLVPYIYAWYSEVELSGFIESIRGAPEVSRIGGLANTGMYVILVLCSYYSPATLIDPRRGRFYGMVIGGACILASGFRSSLLQALAAIGIGGWLHRCWRDLVVGVVVGGMLLAALVIGQGRLYDLPRPAQRALSFLPGQWAPEVVADVTSSSQGRFEMWRRIIDENLIRDWWFGEGFAISAAELALAARHGFVEATYVTGVYHNGPLSTIRYVGIIGLILLYFLTITAAIYSYKTVQRCRGTPLFPAAVFVAIHLIWGPIHYVFVFGSYFNYLPDLIIQLGILRLLMRLCDQGLVAPAPAPGTAPVAARATEAASA
ncbi:MAG: O-antigen ligase family protein [Verrucomicrobiia bacterium]